MAEQLITLTRLAKDTHKIIPADVDAGKAYGHVEPKDAKFLRDIKKVLDDFKFIDISNERCSLYVRSDPMVVAVVKPPVEIRAEVSKNDLKTIIDIYLFFEESTKDETITKCKPIIKKIEGLGYDMVDIK